MEDEPTASQIAFHTLNEEYIFTESKSPDSKGYIGRLNQQWKGIQRLFYKNYWKLGYKLEVACHRRDTESLSTATQAQAIYMVKLKD